MRLLIAGSAFQKEIYVQHLRSLGIEVILSEREDSPISQDLLDVDAVICNWLFVHHNIEQFHNLKYIQLLSAGYDRVPIDYIRDKEIALHNARGVYSIPMAEYAVSGVLQLLKQSALFYEKQRSYIWEKDRSIQELNDKTVLIVGCGSVGTETAKRFSVFTDDVYGVDITIPEKYEWYQKIYHLSNLADVLGNADIVVLTLPLNDETYHLFDESRFAVMKSDAIIVNIARGGVVDESALIDALKDTQRSAVLDVFENEPLPLDSPLWKMNNVLITPHNSFVSDKNEERLWKLCLKNIEDYIKTEGAK